MTLGWLTGWTTHFQTEKHCPLETAAQARKESVGRGEGSARYSRTWKGIKLSLGPRDTLGPFPPEPASGPARKGPMTTDLHQGPWDHMRGKKGLSQRYSPASERGVL